MEPCFGRELGSRTRRGGRGKIVELGDLGVQLTPTLREARFRRGPRSRVPAPERAPSRGLPDRLTSRRVACGSSSPRSRWYPGSATILSSLRRVQTSTGGELMTTLLEAWRSFEPRTRPFVLEGDSVLLESAARRKHTVEINSWEERVGSEFFGRRGDHRLHLSLLPVPFVGDLLGARVVLLLLNPGLSPHDYYAEFQETGMRARILATLRQDVGGQRYPFLDLDPAFAWHSGHTWWHTKLTQLIDAIATRCGWSYAKARAHVASKVAAIELVPYHSEKYALPDGIRDRLQSVHVARRFVAETLLQKAVAGEITLVVTRQSKAWSLPEGDGIVVYTHGEARGAHMTPRTRGGQRILQALLDVT